MSDRALLLLLVLGCATLVTSTIGCTYGLAKSGVARWRVIASLLPIAAVPLAFQAGLRVRAVVAFVALLGVSALQWLAYLR
jgi:hypothetical protein